VVPIVDQPDRDRRKDFEDSDVEEPGGPADPNSSREARPPPTQAEVEEEIGREILGILEESYGRGAASAQAFVTDDWVVVILDDLELLPNEQFLVERGEQDSVAHVRSQYQQAIQTNFRAAIERATGRRVVGFSSSTSVEPPRFMAEVFKLD
jgi:uncharacterized protein YbcI